MQKTLQTTHETTRETSGGPATRCEATAGPIPSAPRAPAATGSCAGHRRALPSAAPVVSAIADFTLGQSDADEHLPVQHGEPAVLRVRPAQPGGGEVLEFLARGQAVSDRLLGEGRGRDTAHP